MKVPKLVIVLLVIIAIFAIGEVLAASSESGSQSMWKEAVVWECQQGDYTALCSSSETQGCRPKTVNNPDTLVLDFNENNVQRETSFGRSYLPIAARYHDRHSSQTILVLGGERTATMHVDGENALIMAPSPGGGSLSLEFFTCQARHE